MASPFEVELSVHQSPDEAQSQAAVALGDAALRVGLRLTGQRPGELQYTPKLQFPFVRMLYHKLQGEKMTVTFSRGSDGGTRVTIRGGVARNVLPLASDPEHWSEALGATAVGS
ncbi:MAG TPA: hypothetical protein VGI50_16570 [Solirubrobacteraceae bacterium]|jgi:hypothetical protein